MLHDRLLMRNRHIKAIQVIFLYDVPYELEVAGCHMEGPVSILEAERFEVRIMDCRRQCMFNRGSDYSKVHAYEPPLKIVCLKLTSTPSGTRTETVAPA